MTAAQLSLPTPSPLALAVLRALPADTFDVLVERCRATLPDADVCSIDSTARALGAEHGDPGRHYYEVTQ